jgi:hypothetical protein
MITIHVKNFVYSIDARVNLTMYNPLTAIRSSTESQLSQNAPQVYDITGNYGRKAMVEIYRHNNIGTPSESWDRVSHSGWFTLEDGELIYDAGITGPGATGHLYSNTLRPMPIKQGPPLPESWGIFWPWYKVT